MKKYLLILASIFTIYYSNAQEAVKVKKIETIVIKTSTSCNENECGEFKSLIEDGLNYLKGVVFAELNYSDRTITVKYKTGVVTPDIIRNKIAEIGYNADDVKATKAGIESLPSCCKPKGHDKN